MLPSSLSPATRIAVLAPGLLVTPIAVLAQPRAKPARIAFLGLSAAPPAFALPPVVAAFEQGLRELGWVEGQKIGRAHV